MKNRKSSIFMAEENPKTVNTIRLGLMVLARQTLKDNFFQETCFPTCRAKDTASCEIVTEDVNQMTVAMQVFGSVPDLLRALPSAQEDYVVFSGRPGLVWDLHLVRRIQAEIAVVEKLGIPWLSLCADGVDREGVSFVSAHFDLEPSLTPDRGRQLIAQTCGTLCVVKISALRDLGLQQTILPDVTTFMSALISVGYASGFASLFSSGLFPCLTEHRGLDYPTLDQQFETFDAGKMLFPQEAVELFPVGVSRQALLSAWIQRLESALKTQHKFSFVIRTLFRRAHLLRRCLISIEYIRSTLRIPVEIVLATDADGDVVQREVDLLQEEFPGLNFVVARGEGFPGFSRVRNLISGLRAASGERVCIIDDDDYYSPHAVMGFDEACAFGAENLIVFDTQIIRESWLFAKEKWHKEIISYGRRFDAKSWRTTLRGSNSIPLCGLIYPGWFARQVAMEYSFDFDLSEDFVLHLLVFTHPKRPPVQLVDILCAYQSHRYGDDNVSNIEDRTNWLLDTGNGLYQLLFESGRSFDVITSQRGIFAEERNRVAELEAELDRVADREKSAIQSLAKIIQQSTIRER